MLALIVFGAGHEEMACAGRGSGLHSSVRDRRRGRTRPIAANAVRPHLAIEPIRRAGGAARPWRLLSGLCRSSRSICEHRRLADARARSARNVLHATFSRDHRRGGRSDRDFLDRQRRSRSVGACIRMDGAQRSRERRLPRALRSHRDFRGAPRAISRSGCGAWVAEVRRVGGRHRPADNVDRASAQRLLGWCRNVPASGARRAAVP